MMILVLVTEMMATGLMISLRSQVMLMVMMRIGRVLLVLLLLLLLLL